MLSIFATKDYYVEPRITGESISQIGSQLSQLSVSQATQDTASQLTARPSQAAAALSKPPLTALQPPTITSPPTPLATPLEPPVSKRARKSTRSFITQTKFKRFCEYETAQLKNCSNKLKNERCATEADDWSPAGHTTTSASS